MSSKYSQRGFSLVELLITIATISALTGISLAILAQYQQRAYVSTALQQGMTLRTAFEAGLSDRTSLGSAIFANNPSLEFSIDGELSCVSGCEAITPNTLFPGFQADLGVKIFFDLFSSTQSYQIQVGHCKALTADGSNYDAWRVSDDQASSRISLPADSNDILQCANVIAGQDLVEDLDCSSQQFCCDPVSLESCSGHRVSGVDLGGGECGASVGECGCLYNNDNPTNENSFWCPGEDYGPGGGGNSMYRGTWTWNSETQECESNFEEGFCPVCGDGVVTPGSQLDTPQNCPQDAGCPNPNVACFAGYDPESPEGHPDNWAGTAGEIWNGSECVVQGDCTFMGYCGDGTCQDSNVHMGNGHFGGEGNSECPEDCP